MKVEVAKNAAIHKESITPLKLVYAASARQMAAANRSTVQAGARDVGENVVIPNPVISCEYPYVPYICN